MVGCGGTPVAAWGEFVSRGLEVLPLDAVAVVRGEAEAHALAREIRSIYCREATVRRVFITFDGIQAPVWIVHTWEGES